MKYDVIVADPPWSFSDPLKMSEVARGAKANYDTMTISDIQGLDVKSLCAPDGAVLCLWVPSSLLQEGLDTMKAWGFKHKQTYIWVKTKKQPFQRVESLYKTAIKVANKINNNPVVTIKDYLKLLHSTIGTISSSSLLAFGMGRLFRQTHEICLVGISSNQVYKKLRNKSRRSVSFGENLKHSSKPEHLQNSLEIMFPQSQKLEMFARRVRSDWTCLGNEIDGKDIRDALADLK
jgi:N6-adenosine-specific RNA methylase IME4